MSRELQCKTRPGQGLGGAGQGWAEAGEGAEAGSGAVSGAEVEAGAVARAMAGAEQGLGLGLP